MPYVTAADVRLWYEEHGEGTPLVLLHGGWVDLGSWQPNIPALARAARVVAYDRRGCGRSTRGTREHSPKAWAADLAELVRGLELEQPVLLGLSYGAMTVLRYLVDGAGPARAAVLASGTAHGFAGSQPGLVSFPEMHDRLHEVRVPTLVLHGELDPVFPLSHAQELAAGIAGAELVSIEGAGHGVNWEQPDAFNHAVLDFLARLDGLPGAQAGQTGATLS